MHKFYVDVPYGHEYKFQGKDDDADSALTREFGVNFTFICNASGSQFHPDRVGVVGNEGDANMVEVETEQDELLFLLKTGFTKLNTEVVENYIKKKRTEELGKRKFNETYY